MGGYTYLQTSNIRHNKYKNLKVSRLVLQLSLPNPLKPGVRSRMGVFLEQRRQVLLQQHLSDPHFCCLLTFDLYYRFDDISYYKCHESILLSRLQDDIKQGPQ